MRVTEVDVARVNVGGSLIALASVVLDDQLYVSGIAVHRTLIGAGYRLTFPTRQIGDRRYCLFHPTDRSLRRAIEDAISTKLAAMPSRSDA